MKHHERERGHAACRRAVVLLVQAAASLSAAPIPTVADKAAALLLCSRVMLLIAESDPLEQARAAAERIVLAELASRGTSPTT